MKSKYGKFATRRVRFGGVMLIAGLAAWMAGPARAATFPDLYTVTVTADPALADPWPDAVRRGMAILLTRITGRQQAATLPAVEAMLRSAESYVGSRGNPSRTQFRIGFIRTAVNEALTGLNLPIWPAERPATLLWVALDLGNGQRAELKADDGSTRRQAATATTFVGAPSERLDAAALQRFETITAEILAAADERGIPLVLPVLDARDREQVRFADVWGGFDGFVMRAAERYGADAVLVARVAGSGTTTEVDWTLVRRDERQQFRTPTPRQGIDFLANEFAAELSMLGDARPTRVTILGVEQWPDFGRVLGYLDGLSVVESVDVESISAGELVLRVVARGDAEQLQRTLTLGGQLEVAEAALPGLPVSRAEGLVLVPSWIERQASPDSP